MRKSEKMEYSVKCCFVIFLFSPECFKIILLCVSYMLSNMTMRANLGSSTGRTAKHIDPEKELLSAIFFEERFASKLSANR